MEREQAFRLVVPNVAARFHAAAAKGVRCVMGLRVVEPIRAVQFADVMVADRTNVAIRCALDDQPTTGNEVRIRPGNGQAAGHHN